MRKASNIARHELMGLHVEVIAAGDPGMTGLEGTISDETKNTLTIKKKTEIGR